MQQELLDRLDLIERMIQEGRQTTQYWGWVPLLWGVGQITAVLWVQMGGHPFVAWSVTMWTCAILNGIGSWVCRRHQPAHTTVGRALSAVWTGVLICLFIFGFLGGSSGMLDGRGILVVVLCLQGLGYFATGFILRWPTQIGLALLWWIATGCAMFVSLPHALLVFLIATIVGDVLFGLYLMILERRGKTCARAA
jgi:hypothetical protein